MNIEEKLEQCEFNLKQIIHYNPDPYYVNHFLMKFVQYVSDIYNGIIEEADRDFGLFIVGKYTLQEFERKSKEKNDDLALEFFYWYNKNYNQEHKAAYPNYIKNLIYFYEKTGDLPKIKIKIISDKRYKDDISQEILVDLSKGKIRSKDQLELEIKRQIPIFLELINNKRKNNGEPKVSVNQIMASAFIDTGNNLDFEILDVCQAYLPVLRRFVDSARRKISQLTRFEND